MRIDPRLIGFTAHRFRVPLSKPTSAICSIRRLLDPLRSSSSFLAQLPFGVPSLVHLAAHLTMLGFTCLWVSLPLRDITRKQLRFFAELPTPHFVPSSGFRNLSTVSSALELAGLFHPAATSRVIFRSGASLPPQPPFLIGRSLPPCCCCSAAHTHGPTFAGSLACPRAMPLSFEAFICARPRSSGPVIHLAQSRSPLRISRSFRYSLSRRPPPLSRLRSAHDVTRSMFNERDHLAMTTVALICEVTELYVRPGKS